MRLHRRARSRRGAHCAPGERCRCASYVPAHHGLKLWPARPHCGQEGEHLRFSPSCQSTPFPLGRAARVRVSDAFRLPPICCVRVSGTVATPGVRTVQCIHPVGRAKLAWATTSARQTGVDHAPRRAKLAWATTRRAKRCVHPVGARIARPHSTRPERRLCGNSIRTPAREVRAHTSPHRANSPRGRAMRAPTMQAR